MAMVPDTLVEADADADLKHPDGRYTSQLIVVVCFGQTLLWDRQSTPARCERYGSTYAGCRGR